MDAAITSTCRRDEKEEGAEKESHFVENLVKEWRPIYRVLSMESRLRQLDWAFIWFVALGKLVDWGKERDGHLNKCGGTKDKKGNLRYIDMHGCLCLSPTVCLCSHSCGCIYILPSPLSRGLLVSGHKPRLLGCVKLWLCRTEWDHGTLYPS